MLFGDENQGESYFTNTKDTGINFRHSIRLNGNAVCVGSHVTIRNCARADRNLFAIARSAFNRGIRRIHRTQVTVNAYSHR